MSALFAATRPDRVSALILMGSFASGAAWLARSDELGYRLHDRVTDMLEHWGEGRTLDLFAPSAAGRERARRFGAFERAVGSPAAMAARWHTCTRLDVTPVLVAIRAPTLVLHRGGERTVPSVVGRELAEAIPTARYVEVPGADHVPWAGDADRILAEVEDFLTGARANSIEGDRVLATVLFVDSSLPEAYDELVRERLASYRGREVRTTGDGVLIAFDGPARAIRCACEIAQQARALGIDVRAGVHSGECDLRGDELAGVAVDIGAAVGAIASGGEVLVSSTVKDLVVGSGIEFEDRGVNDLESVPGPWRLFAVTDGLSLPG